MLLLYRNRLLRIKVASHSETKRRSLFFPRQRNDAVRLLGVLLAIAGSVGLARSVRGTLGAKRPKDVAFALLAVVATIVALVGLGMAFVPGFFL